jgi:glycosyltransferase involved in cell wall biosynthesis
MSLARLRQHLPNIPARAPRSYEPIPDSCLYVTSSCLPFHVSGYTVRTQALVKAIAASGVRMSAALRPGYLGERSLTLPGGRHSHEGVEYLHSPGASKYIDVEQVNEVAARDLTELTRRTRPQLIHAASNHANALPALLAARRLGLPFVYEVRGMWELTAASKKANWERSERFGLEQDLEALVAREADHVLTLTEGLRTNLIERGVAPDSVSLLPNAVDHVRFAPRAKDLELLARFGIENAGFTLVYAGSLLPYEGLDDLLRALAHLVGAGIDAKLIMAGEGESRDMLSELVSELGLEGHVHFTGRLDPYDIPRLWSLADAAAFPRKPFRVCQLVSPLKPLEPMVMGIPVVVSSVAALREMVQDGDTGLVHRAGDPLDLAAKLSDLAGDPQLSSHLGQQARKAVLRDRTWDATGSRVAALYRQLLARPASPVDRAVLGEPGGL